jgi:hypothetical protein
MKVKKWAVEHAHFNGHVKSTVDSTALPMFMPLEMTLLTAGKWQ